MGSVGRARHSRAMVPTLALRPASFCRALAILRLAWRRSRFDPEETVDPEQSRHSPAEKLLDCVEKMRRGRGSSLPYELACSRCTYFQVFLAARGTFVLSTDSVDKSSENLLRIGGERHHASMSVALPENCSTHRYCFEHRRCGINPDARIASPPRRHWRPGRGCEQHQQQRHIRGFSASAALMGTARPPANAWNYSRRADCNQDRRRRRRTEQYGNRLSVNEGAPFLHKCPLS